MDWLQQARQRMVRDQLAKRGVSDPRVLAALGQVPRHLFVPEQQRHQAYADCALPIDADQTISQPFIVARMAEALALTGGERVLEIGTGSGYAAAVLAELAGSVVTVERHAELAEAARERLAGLGYESVAVVAGDGTLGWPSAAPYDAISVPAGAPEVPPALLQQLAEGGRLIIPVGSAQDQRLLRVRRAGERFEREWLEPVRFVPLIGAQGWAP
ncbi:MAG TPA: protein-L-isoaspartate(D-aspartate) O-methyltransferase [Herpetosiphonaceae bacterium]